MPESFTLRVDSLAPLSHEEGRSTKVTTQGFFLQN